MLLAQIEGFLEVASRRNVTRAAEALGLTQPALTSRLKNLERELGTRLFVRAAHGVRLTESGREFLPYAQRALDAVREGRALLGEVRRGRGGRLLIGAAPAVSTYVLPYALSRFRAVHPAVDVSVRTGHSEEVLELVLREEVQVGLTRTLRSAEVEAVPLYEDELALVVAPRHPFAERGVVRLDDIGGERLVLFDRTSSYHELTSAFFREAGVVPRGMIEVDNIDAAKKMAEQGLGVALLPRTALAAELAAGSLRDIRIADGAPPRRRIVAIRPRGAEPTPVVAAFLEILVGMARSAEVPFYGAQAELDGSRPPASGAYAPR